MSGLPELAPRSQLTLYDADSGLASALSHAPRPSLTQRYRRSIDDFTSPHHTTSSTPKHDISNTRCTDTRSPPAMKLTALLLAAISAVSVSATPSWMPGQVTIQEDYKVPGDNPLYFCEDPKDNILEIEKVDLDPNPPVPYVATRMLSLPTIAIEPASRGYGDIG